MQCSDIISMYIEITLSPSFQPSGGIQCDGLAAVLAGERLDCLDNQGKGRGKDGSDVKAFFCLAAGASLF